MYYVKLGLVGAWTKRREEVNGARRIRGDNKLREHQCLEEMLGVLRVRK